MVGEPQEAVKDAVWEEVKLHFRPEFLNRIDDVVVFHALDRTNIESIAKIQLQRLHERLAKLDMQLDVSDAALEQIGKVGYDPLFGARPLKRAIQQEIENPVAKLILAGQVRAEGRDSGRCAGREVRVRSRRALSGALGGGTAETSRFAHKKGQRRRFVALFFLSDCASPARRDACAVTLAFLPNRADRPPSEPSTVVRSAGLRPALRHRASRDRRYAAAPAPACRRVDRPRRRLFPRAR